MPCISRERSSFELAGELEVGEAREQLLEHHARLECARAGRRGRGARRSRTRGGGSWRGRAPTSKRSASSQDLFVAVGGSVEQQQHVALADRLAAQLGVAAAVRMKLCTGVNQRSISSTAFGSRLGSASRRRRCSGLRISSSEPPEIRLRVVSLPAASSVMQNIRISRVGEPLAVDLGVRERRDQVVLRRARRSPSTPRKYASISPSAASVAALRRRRLPRSSRRTSAEVAGGPARHAEHLGDHVHRQRHRERFDEIGRPHRARSRRDTRARSCGSSARARFVAPGVKAPITSFAMAGCAAGGIHLEDRRRDVRRPRALDVADADLDAARRGEALRIARHGERRRRASARTTPRRFPGTRAGVLAPQPAELRVRVAEEEVRIVGSESLGHCCLPVSRSLAIVAISSRTTFSTFCSKIARICSQVTGSSSSFQQS